MRRTTEHHDQAREKAGKLLKHMLTVVIEYIEEKKPAVDDETAILSQRLNALIFKIKY